MYDPKRGFCPFRLLRHYLRLRGGYKAAEEQLFVFHDHSPLKAAQARKTLKCCIKNLGLEEKLYNFHSMSIGMASQMVRNLKSLEEVKRAGRWRSNAVYKYLKL